MASVNSDVLEFPTLVEIPEPPEWVAKVPEAKKEWENKTALLYGQKVLTDADLTLLGHYCILHADLVEQYSIPRHQPSAADRSQLRMYASEFGFTTSSRMRIGAGGGEKGQNPFNGNGKKET